MTHAVNSEYYTPIAEECRAGIARQYEAVTIFNDGAQLLSDRSHLPPTRPRLYLRMILDVTLLGCGGSDLTGFKKYAFLYSTNWQRP